MSLCARCKRASPAHADTWCLACSAWEALGTELGFAWHHPGLRVVASDVLVSAARTVRALRVTRGAAPSAGHARALPSEASAPAAERPPLARQLKKEELESETGARGSGVQGPVEEESGEVESEEEESEASEATIVPPGTPEQGLASKASAPRPAEKKDRSPEAGASTVPVDRRSEVRDPRERPAGSKRPRQEHHRRRHHRGEEKGEKKRSRKRRPKHRAGRKHKRLRRAEANPFVPLHRSLDRSHFEFDPNQSKHEAIPGLPPTPKKR